MAAQDHREACGPARHHGGVEPHKQVGLSPLVASRRPRGAERNGLAWKPVAEDHRTGVEGIEGRNEPEEAGTRGAKGALGLLVWKLPERLGAVWPLQASGSSPER